MRPRADRQRPRVARGVGQLKVRVEADGDRHRFRTQVDDRRLYFEHPVVQAMGNLDGVRERPLSHPHRLPIELEPARHPGGFGVGVCLHDLPSISRRDEPVTRHVAAYVAELHVEGVSATVREERQFVEAINPGTEKRDAAHPRTRFERLDRLVRPVENLLAFHVHLERDVADRRQDRDGRLRPRVVQLHDVAVAD